jgi:hypothetical protein
VHKDPALTPILASNCVGAQQPFHDHATDGGTVYRLSLLGGWENSVFLGAQEIAAHAGTALSA